MELGRELGGRLSLLLALGVEEGGSGKASRGEGTWLRQALDRLSATASSSSDSQASRRVACEHGEGRIRGWDDRLQQVWSQPVGARALGAARRRQRCPAAWRRPSASSGKNRGGRREKARKKKGPVLNLMKFEKF